MENEHEEIEIEISRELLGKVRVIAEMQGITAEEYIGSIVDQYANAINHNTS